jgi:hypothetical protein
MWNKKQKRAYHRCKSGIKVSTILHIPIKHLVLTTSPEASARNTANDFQTLRKRIQRKFGFNLSYFLVHTSEGNHFFEEHYTQRGREIKPYYRLFGGVLHILYRSKKYLPQKWVSNQWEDIHKSCYIYIKEVPDTDIARYVVTQYVANQGTTYQRCSWSQSWVQKGFVKAWQTHLRWYHQYRFKLNLDFMDLLNKWDRWIENQVIKQKTLF